MVESLWASGAAQAVSDALTYLVSSWDFDICGLTVSVATPDSYLLSLCQTYFRFYQQTSSRFSASTIRINLIPVSSSTDLAQYLPQDAEFVGQQEITTVWKNRRCGQERYYFHFTFGNALFRVEPERGQIVGIISPNALEWPHLMVNTYVFMTLMLALRWRGLYHLHTAAVLAPSQGLTLICGGQRAGKTTLTTALGIAGWHPLSDDGVVIKANDQGQPEMQAFKRDFHLAAALLQQWPSLRQIEARYFYYDRACVDGLSLFQTEALASQTFTQVERVIFPQVSGEMNSRLAPMPTNEAMQRLIGQSMFFPLGRTHTQTQMALLTTLVKNTRCYRLFAGTDIWENPHRAVELLTA